MIYFDNSATTKVHPEVLTTYTKVSEAIWGNPSSLHKMGENAYNLLEQSSVKKKRSFLLVGVRKATIGRSKAQHLKKGSMVNT